MNRPSWPVGPQSARPAGDPGRCFYCHEPLGGTHAPECVIRTRTVVVELTIQLVMTMPESFDAGHVEFNLNESGCSDNTIDRLGDLADRLNDAGRCTCNIDHFEAKFVREATAEDEEAQRLYVSEVPS